MFHSTSTRGIEEEYSPCFQLPHDYKLYFQDIGACTEACNVHDPRFQIGTQRNLTASPDSRICAAFLRCNMLSAGSASVQDVPCATVQAGDTKFYLVSLGTSTGCGRSQPARLHCCWYSPSSVSCVVL